MIDKIIIKSVIILKNVTFIHAADLHLDSPFQGLTHLPATLFEEVRHSTFAAFDKLIQQAILYHVDFLLLAGDLFDHDVQSLKAQIHIRDAFLKLQKYDIQVYLSHGNHDFVHKDNQQVKFSDNVFVFPDEEIRSFIYKQGEESVVEIHGFSYEKRAVTEEKAIHYPSRNPNITFHIGMLHGALYGNATHHAYAPFKLQQLEEKSYDYWALGHIHKRAILSKEPPIIYPGNIQGRHRKETGDKGCYLVRMTEKETTVSFIALQQIQFTDLSINIAEVETVDDVEALLQQALVKLTDGPYLIHLTWENVIPNQLGVNTEQLLYELTEIMNNQIEDETPWQFIYHVKVRFAKGQEQKVNALFMEEAANAFRALDVQKEIGDMLQHPKARKFLELPSDQELLTEAKDSLLRKLQRSEGQNQ